MGIYLAKISPIGELAEYHQVIAESSEEAYEKALDFAIARFGGMVSVQIQEDIL